MHIVFLTQNMPEHLNHICKNQFAHQRNAASSLILHKHTKQEILLQDKKNNTPTYMAMKIQAERNNTINQKLKFCQDTGNILFLLQSFFRSLTNMWEYVDGH